MLEATKKKEENPPSQVCKCRFSGISLAVTSALAGVLERLMSSKSRDIFCTFCIWEQTLSSRQNCALSWNRHLITEQVGLNVFGYRDRCWTQLVICKTLLSKPFVTGVSSHSTVTMAVCVEITIIKCHAFSCITGNQLWRGVPVRLKFPATLLSR